MVHGLAWAIEDHLRAVAVRPVSEKEAEGMPQKLVPRLEGIDQAHRQCEAREMVQACELNDSKHRTA